MLGHPPRAHGRLRRHQRRRLTAALGDVRRQPMDGLRADRRRHGRHPRRLPALGRLQGAPETGRRGRRARGGEGAPVRRGGVRGRERHPESVHVLPRRAGGAIRPAGHAAQRGGSGRARAAAAVVEDRDALRGGPPVRLAGGGAHGGHGAAGRGRRRVGRFSRVGDFAEHVRHVLRLVLPVGHPLRLRAPPGVRHAVDDGPCDAGAAAVRRDLRGRLPVGHHLRHHGRQRRQPGRPGACHPGGHRSSQHLSGLLLGAHFRSRCCCSGESNFAPRGRKARFGPRRRRGHRAELAQAHPHEGDDARAAQGGEGAGGRGGLGAA
mmetsp:Transcript_54602/g.137872  ORF Transcript_54602/g.137872 Transcript_54602/m.137872 type:complete len:321 (-) Transcript_54602:92-1054(-)